MVLIKVINHYHKGRLYSYENYNGSGINVSENIGANMGASFLSIPRLFGVGDSSPDIKNYSTPNSADGVKEHSRTEYYRDNFSVKDENGKERMTIDTGLLPSSNTVNINTGPKTIIDITGGK